MVGEQLAHALRALGEDGEHQVLNGEILVVQLFGGLFGKVQDLADLGRGIDLAAAAGDARELADESIDLREQTVTVDAHLAKEGSDQSAVLIEQGVEQMLACHILVAVFLRHVLRGLDGFQSLLRIFFSIHSSSPQIRVFYN